MRNALQYIFLSLLALFVSCSDNGFEHDNGIVDENSKIYLRAATENNSVVVGRAPYELENPTTTNPLYATVWASTVRYKYPNSHNIAGGVIADGSGTDGSVALHANARFQSSNPQLLSAAIYNQENTIPVYFVAFHPQAGWLTNAANNSAIFNFDGSQDVMFASEVQGEYATDYDQSPQLLFKHLLTWIKLEVSAESEEVAIAWGKIKNITIRSKCRVEIDLSKAFSINNCVAFSDDAQLNFYAKDTDDDFPGTTPIILPHGALTEVAYVICSPVQATAVDPIFGERTTEYVITVETENRPKTVINVDLKDGVTSWLNESTMGKQFTVALKFKMGNAITVATTIDDWKTAGIGDAVLNEKP